MHTYPAERWIWEENRLYRGQGWTRLRASSPNGHASRLRGLVLGQQPVHGRPATEGLLRVRARAKYGARCDTRAFNARPHNTRLSIHAHMFSAVPTFVFVTLALPTLHADSAFAPKDPGQNPLGGTTCLTLLV